MDFKDTLKMPRTDFPMRGNLGVREVEIQEKWKNLDLYNKVLEKNKDNTPFILHDGPPYANGNIHIGHAFQKTVKDFVLRYKTMMGYYTPYIPGWDTHGLPIENEVTKKGVNRKEISRAEFLKHCRDFALTQVEEQKKQFVRLGILGEWDNPYITLDNSFVSDQIKYFAKMVEKGLIYRGLKPVFWSPSSESALAEAEVEYEDKNSPSIYFTFEIVEGAHKGANLIIWTTTPWTLTGNLAVSANPNFFYHLFESNGTRYIVLEDLYEKLVNKLGLTDAKIIDTFKGSVLENEMYKHPLFDRTSPVIIGEHVTNTDGTGLVHTAPGFGEDDYNIGREYNLDILAPVNDRGILTSDAYQYEGEFYEKANDIIINDLKDNGNLLLAETILHSYPHDWRTHKPIIFRATPQWFFSVEKIKEPLLKEVRNVKWIPSWGETRLFNMLESRTDWVISRQRAWGVPIPIFYDSNGEPVLDPEQMLHIADLFSENGSNYWYEADVEDLLLEKYKNQGFTKEMDIMDVWFDSGTSYSVLKERGLPFPADLYLEGSDQYRGWFNSSIITSVAINGVSPYKQIVSHGFVLDGRGRKMSKSLGNVIDPLKVINQSGADVLRLWVSSVTYQSDVRISDDLLRQVSESYRRIRNTIRFSLGNIGDLRKDSYLDYSDRELIDKVFYNKFYLTKVEMLKAYENYDFDRIYRLILPFIVNDLSAYYLDYTKDILYILKEDDKIRRSVQSTLYDILKEMLILLTPIIPHTTSEAYDHLPFKDFDDVYLENMPVEKLEIDKDVMDAFDKLYHLRDLTNKELEIKRDEKLIGKPLEAHINLELTSDYLEMIDVLEIKNLHQLLLVSSVNIKEGNKLVIEVLKHPGVTCERCWNVVDSVNEVGLCPRCESVLKE